MLAAGARGFLRGGDQPPVRIHLGHHFYGAGNLGDDFMLAGFLGALAQLAPGPTLTCSVPFALEPLQRRFPEIEWLPYSADLRSRAIAACDVWLGLGGSPFQHAQSRWFVDHLLEEAALCAREGKPMYYLGIGIQSAEEAAADCVRQLCAQATAIWTRDPASAERLQTGVSKMRIESAADLAHGFFRRQPPPPAVPGRLCLVANFDYGGWPGQPACLAAIDELNPAERVWLAQETRELPGAERALHATLPESERSRWRLVAPDIPGAPLERVLAGWPSGEWLVTARYHAALAGAWAGSKVVVIGTNEKLRAAAREIGAPLLAPDADQRAVREALLAARPVAMEGGVRPLAEKAFAACAGFVAASGIRSGIRSALRGGTEPS